MKYIRKSLYILLHQFTFLQTMSLDNVKETNLDTIKQQKAFIKYY